MNGRFNLQKFTSSLFSDLFSLPAPTGFVPYYIGKLWPVDDYVIEFKHRAPIDDFQRISDRYNEPWMLVPLAAIDKLSYQPKNGVVVRIVSDGQSFMERSPQNFEVKEAQNLNSHTAWALQKAGFLYVGIRQPFVTLWCANQHSFEVDGDKVELTQKHQCPECGGKFGLSQSYGAGSYFESILLTKMLLFLKNLGQKMSPIRVGYSSSGYVVRTIGGTEVSGDNLAKLFEQLELPVVALRSYTILEVAQNTKLRVQEAELPTVLPASLGAVGEWWDQEDQAEFRH